uniref:streptococcal hemagglutinin-like isoform X2 n=1 Tax=Pristiophorus japonicus TaxID=55135 RepID=UPI00398F50CC
MFLAVLLVTASLVFGGSCRRWKDEDPFFVARKCLKFDVLCNATDYQVRQYNESVWLGTRITQDQPATGSSAWQSAKQLLIQYTQGANAEGSVFDSTGQFLSSNTADEMVNLYLLLPAEVQANPPTPNDNRVFIEVFPELTVYVRSFRGRPRRVKNQVTALNDSLTRDSVMYNDSTYYVASCKQHGRFWTVVRRDAGLRDREGRSADSSAVSSAESTAASASASSAESTDASGAASSLENSLEMAPLGEQREKRTAGRRDAGLRDREGRSADSSAVSSAESTAASASASSAESTDASGAASSLENSLEMAPLGEQREKRTAGRRDAGLRDREGRSADSSAVSSAESTAASASASSAESTDASGAASSLENSLEMAPLGEQREKRTAGRRDAGLRDREGRSADSSAVSSAESTAASASASSAESTDASGAASSLENSLEMAPLGEQREKRTAGRRDAGLRDREGRSADSSAVSSAESTAASASASSAESTAASAAASSLENSLEMAPLGEQREKRTAGRRDAGLRDREGRSADSSAVSSAESTAASVSASSAESTDASAAASSLENSLEMAPLGEQREKRTAGRRDAGLRDREGRSADSSAVSSAESTAASASASSAESTAASAAASSLENSLEMAPLGEQREKRVEIWFIATGVANCPIA